MVCTDPKSGWAFGLLFGTIGSFVCQAGLTFIQKEADVERERNENQLLKRYSEQLDREIVRLEEAWKVEEARRNEEGQKSQRRWFPWMK